jgi:hypothetical protein
MVILMQGKGNHREGHFRGIRVFTWLHMWRVLTIICCSASAVQQRKMMYACGVSGDRYLCHFNDVDWKGTQHIFS